jgi:hypothetical protein
VLAHEALISACGTVTPFPAQRAVKDFGLAHFAALVQRAAAGDKSACC